MCIQRFYQAGEWAMSRTLAIGFGVLALASAPAFAADLPVKARPMPVATVYNWTGFYVGGAVGGTWGRAGITHSPILAAPGLAFPIDAAAVTTAASPDLKPTGWTGGLYAGYNYQVGSIVWGVETDISFFRLRGSQNGVFPFPSTLPGGPLGPPTLTFTSSTSLATDWLFTFRPRVGWAWDNWLLYVTGGLAVTEEKVAQTAGVLNAATFTSSISSTRAGWVVGGGVEWAIARNWIARAEYLHVDFGTVSGSGIGNMPTGILGNLLCVTGQTVITGPGTYTGCSISSRLTSEIVRAGLSYKFDAGPVVARY
jgi:outer membrane immunogenic protein